MAASVGNGFGSIGSGNYPMLDPDVGHCPADGRAKSDDDIAASIART
ncbi:MAG: hypothetical protein J6K73_15860 [Clostridia bacterium]|nr:hypothetical protein [Clostridia bacterium]MBP3651246.1 hypothetical protein [Clostridia bacterium]